MSEDRCGLRLRSPGSGPVPRTLGLRMRRGGLSLHGHLGDAGPHFGGKSIPWAETTAFSCEEPPLPAFREGAHGRRQSLPVAAGL